MGCPTFTSKTAPPFDDLHPSNIPILDWPHSPPLMASRSNQPFFHNSPTKQTDTHWPTDGIGTKPLHIDYSDAANNGTTMLRLHEWTSPWLFQMYKTCVFYFQFERKEQLWTSQCFIESKKSSHCSPLLCSEWHRITHVIQLRTQMLATIHSDVYHLWIIHLF